MRKTLAEEFSTIHVYNLRGNQRTAGEQSRKEGGKIFDAGSRATVAITILVKDPAKAGPATIHYTDIGDYLTREGKLRTIAASGSLAGLDTVDHIAPNAYGDWLNQRAENFESFLPIGTKGIGPSIFTLTSGGLKTARDAWVYNYSEGSLRSNMATMIAAYNHERSLLAANPSHLLDVDPTRISWTRGLTRDAHRDREHKLRDAAVRRCSYRAFTAQRLYFGRDMNDMIYRSEVLFPTPIHANRAIVMTGVGAAMNYTPLMVSGIPDASIFGGQTNSQALARWTYAPDQAGGLLIFTEGDKVVAGYRRIDNVTDEALRRFQTAYGDDSTKDGIFFYVYGLLHSPEYRETYAADLKKMLPRIPLVVDAQPFIDAGRKLSELHLGYESVTPYPLDGLDVEAEAGSAAYDFFRVKKMHFSKPTAQQTAVGERHDRTTIVYNNRITLGGIPEAAYRYMLGSRSAIEWIMDRYQVRTDKASGIVNDPNDWSREVEDPRYIIDLLARIVTVSLETMQIVDNLPH